MTSLFSDRVVLMVMVVGFGLGVTLILGGLIWMFIEVSRIKP